MRAALFVAAVAVLPGPAGDPRPDGHLPHALDLEIPGERAGFVDVEPSDTHAGSIDALLAAGITTGCSSRPLRFCPDRPVTRAQMATFLIRALAALERDES